MKTLLVLPALAMLAACATLPPSPLVENGPAAAEGTAVPLGQPVMVGAVVATPMQVIEDSRCPQNARCVWAGRLVVLTRIDGTGWRETERLTLGQPATVRNVQVALVSGLPEKRADHETQPAEYRFVFEGG